MLQVDRFSQTFQHKIHSALDSYAPSNFSLYAHLKNSGQLLMATNGPDLSPTPSSAATTPSSHHQTLSRSHSSESLSMALSSPRERQDESGFSFADLLPDSWSLGRSATSESKSEQSPKSDEGPLDAVYSWMVNLVSSDDSESNEQSSSQQKSESTPRRIRRSSHSGLRQMEFASEIDELADADAGGYESDAEDESDDSDSDDEPDEDGTAAEEEAAAAPVVPMSPIFRSSDSLSLDSAEAISNFDEYVDLLE